MANRSPEKLLKLFESNEVVELKDIQSALDNASRATCFRYLKQVPYHRSYNYNGRYYTRKDPTRYDRFGLFWYEGIFFSRDNTLGETIPADCANILDFLCRKLDRSDTVCRYSS